MKLTIRRTAQGHAAYIAKKDLEEPVVAQDRPALWGGRITLGNGWVFELPLLDAATPLPLTVEARRVEAG